MKNICTILAICLLSVGVANAQNFDNFEDYPAGATIPAGNDWVGWGGAAAANCLVTAGPAHSGENSLAAVGGAGTDQCFEFGYGQKTGAWDFSAMTYVPREGSAGETYFNLMNVFDQVNGVYQWSNLEMHWMMDPNHADTGMVWNQDNAATKLAIQYDTWVEVSANIDLDNNSLEVFYGGTPLGGALTWTDDPVNGIEVMDIYPISGDASVIYYDDVGLSAVPEPSSIVLLLIGGLFCLLGLRRRK